MNYGKSEKDSQANQKVIIGYDNDNFLKIYISFVFVLLYLKKFINETSAVELFADNCQSNRRF